MITGYLIVKKPEFEEAYYGGPFLGTMKGFYYHGLYRSMWVDVKDYFMANPNDILSKQFKKIQSSGEDESHLAISQDETLVNNLLNITFEIQKKNEVIVVSSNYLNRIKGSFEANKQIEWLGYDPVQLGGWSLLRHGIFENRIENLLEQDASINQHGLFNSPDFANGFINEYNKIANENKVDPLLDDLIFDWVRIGKVR